MDSTKIIVLIIIFFGYLFTGIGLYNDMVYDNIFEFIGALVFAGGAISLLLCGIVGTLWLIFNKLSSFMDKKN